MDSAKIVVDPWVLPRGVAAADREAVAEAQRGRILVGVMTAVAKSGYAGTTIADIVRIAGVSRKTFYELFSDKQAAYLALYQQNRKELLSVVLPADAADKSWEQVVIESHRAYFNFVADRPEAAVACLLEVYAAGAAAVKLHTDGRRQFAKAYASLLQFETAGTASPIPADIVLIVIYGVDGVVADYVREGRTRDLRDLEPSLTSITRMLRAATADTTTQDC